MPLAGVWCSAIRRGSPQPVAAEIIAVAVPAQARGATRRYRTGKHWMDGVIRRAPAGAAHLHARLGEEPRPYVRPEHANRLLATCPVRPRSRCFRPGARPVAGASAPPTAP